MKTKLFSTLIISVSLLLGACATTHHNPRPCGGMAMSGAALGAAIGALSRTDGGDRHDIGKGALVGAAVGGAAACVTAEK